MAEESIYDETVAATQKSLDEAASESQKALDQGFIGDKVDENPNEVYTVAGVTGQLKSSKKKS